ncbi:MAG: nitroreductase family protein [Dehalococcoidia bacterium]|nr:nitroreductase family protein [Dehalococcoidia bacterium]
MEALAAIHRRRSVKLFASEPVPLDALEQLLEAAYDAPSGANYQHCQFVVVTEREVLDSLGETHPHCAWLKSAQAAIAVLSDPTRSRYWLEDCCVAVQNIWIAATALGLGMAWAAMFQSDNPEETARREGLVREAVGIPAKLRVPVVLGLGLPAAEPGERKRPLLAELVHWGHYGKG